MIASITILETNFSVEFDYKITSHGSPGTGPSLNYPGDPPEGAEYTIEVLALFAEKSKEPLEVPAWLKLLLEEELYNRDDVNDAIQQADADRGADDYYEE